MEVEEPLEKVETTVARGECELKTDNETPKKGIKNLTKVRINSLMCGI